jgi:hypothetical protein
MVQFYSEIAKKRKTVYTPHLYGGIMKIVGKSSAFIYPSLLPNCGFSPNFTAFKFNTFLPSEDK